MINRVHSNTTNHRSSAKPPTITSFLQLLGAMRRVGDGANCSPAASIDHLADARRETDENAARGGGFFEDFGNGAGRTDEFSAFTGAELDVVD